MKNGVFIQKAPLTFLRGGNSVRSEKSITGFPKQLIALLFAVQPCLDVLAYWTRNEHATPAGYIRLVLLVLIPVVTFVLSDQKKRLLAFYAVAGLFCLLHILNAYRIGYISPVYDIRYLASVIQMPVFAVCFITLIRNEETKEAALLGLKAAAVLTLLFFVVSRMTGTGNVTYGEGLGYSGWVIDENRNANSTIFVILGCFCTYFALSGCNRVMLYAVPVVIDLVYLSNGTKGCYFSIFAIFISFAAYLLYEKLVLKKELARNALILLLALAVFSAAVYPWTPRYKVTEAQRMTARGTQGEIEATLLEKGIDITDMSPQERFDNPAVKEVFEFYYWKYLGVKPDLIDRFSMDRVLMQYHMSTDVAKLIDARVMERNYADMVFQDSDTLTKIVGFEASEMGFDGVYDLENDWHAVFYYYGYLGFALYVGFVLAVIIRFLRMLFRSLRSGIGMEPFAYLLVLVLVLGLAHFSGATLRRPNVSIWLSLILALLSFTVEEKTHETQCDSSGIQC